MIKSIDWENAINIRRSTRSYEMCPIEEEKMNLLKGFISNMKVPIEHNVSIRMFKANPDKKLYTVFASPPDNAAFITNTDCCSISAAGFIGEIFILYATSMSLATCWYGHYALEELERVMPHLVKHAEMKSPKWGYGKDEVEGERAICITPLGYWKQSGVRFFDRMQESLISYKRKSIGELLENGIKEDDLPPEISYAIDLARKAPSAANSQHWRFTISPDFKTVSIAMPVGYKHIKWEHPNVDIGICASHFWLGLMLKKIESKVTLSEEQNRAVWRFDI